MSNGFYRKRNLFAATAISLLLFGGAQAYVVTKSNLRHSEQTKSEQAKVAAISKDKKAIDSAVTYLSNTMGEVEPPQRLILDYLYRKFDLNEKLSIEGSVFRLPEDAATYPSEIHYAARIAYPDRLVTVPPKQKPTGAEYTNIYSANCDHIALPPDYWQVMEQSYQAGGYHLTHVALAFAFMKDNGCLVPADKADLQTKVNQGMVNLAADPKTVADLRYEAIAFLMLSGNFAAVQPSWMDSIIAEQLPSGGWSEKRGSKQPSDHATVLALWALLEYTNPNSPYEPLIRRPSVIEH